MHRENNTLMDKQIEKFSAELEQAFPIIPLPTRVVNASSLTEPASTQKMLFGKKWNELEISEIQKIWGDISICGSLPYLTVEAFKYYLPFYMSHCIFFTSKENTADIEMLMRMLGSDYKENDTPQYIMQNISSFTLLQKRVISNFARIAGDLYSAYIPANEFENLLKRYT